MKKSTTPRLTDDELLAFVKQTAQKMEVPLTPKMLKADHFTRIQNQDRIVSKVSIIKTITTEKLISVLVKYPGTNVSSTYAGLFITSSTTETDHEYKRRVSGILRSQRDFLRREARMKVASLEKEYREWERLCKKFGASYDTEHKS